ncbi:hypothetical protein ES703_84459 [subsurface metagenome]
MKRVFVSVLVFMAVMFAGVHSREKIRRVIFPLKTEYYKEVFAKSADKLLELIVKSERNLAEEPAGKITATPLIKDIVWEKTYGGKGEDIAHSIQQTKDGGYIIAGYTTLKGANGMDFWILKIDEKGGITWDKTYNRSSADKAHSIRQTEDEGYVIAGGPGFWVLKIGNDGSIIWNKTYNKVLFQYALSVYPTKDRGCVAAGHRGGRGIYQAAVFKLDVKGNIIWEKSYGGERGDEFYSVRQAKDGGYIIAGSTTSKGAGGKDLWVFKLNKKGDTIWDKAYGGKSDDMAYSIQHTEDEGCIAAGYTASKGAGGMDFWILKLNEKGNIVWEKTYGGKGNDKAYSIQQTEDDGYIVAGYTASKGAGDDDIWILKLDKNGNFK